MESLANENPHAIEARLVFGRIFKAFVYGERLSGANHSSHLSPSPRT